jgi:hypothetical protein
MGSVACETSATKEIGCVGASALYMRIMTRDAAQAAVARPPTSAQLHLFVLIEQNKVIFFN